MKKIIVLALLVLVAPVMADTIVEYKTADGEKAIYSRNCYDSTPNKVVKSPDGGYLFEVAVTEDDCRITGESFAKVERSIRNLDFGTWTKFTSDWMTTGEAEAEKTRLDTEYKNTLGLWCPSQHVEILTKRF